MTESSSSDLKAELTLPKTGLCVGESSFWRKNRDGSVLMQIPLNEIESLSFTRPLNPISIFFVAAAAGLIALGVYVSRTDWLSVFLYILAGIVGFIGLFGSMSDRLTIERRTGEKLVFDCNESAEDVRQFIMCVRDRL